MSDERKAQMEFSKEEAELLVAALDTFVQASREAVEACNKIQHFGSTGAIGELQVAAGHLRMRLLAAVRGLRG